MKMKTIVRLLALSVCVPLAFAKPPADAQARLEGWSNGRPGVIADAWVDGDGTVFFCSGKFSAEDARRITPDTQFQIGSVTKIFTALLLAESERLGKVSREDPAAKFLLPADDPAQRGLAAITLLSLATHTSGLPRMPPGLTATDGANPYAAHDRAALVKALRTAGAGVPGSRSAVYSNFGVAVLGEALGAAWGGTYAEALRARVLVPLGLGTTTLALSDGTLPAALAPGHVGRAPVVPWRFQAMAPAGALMSSARELSVFLAFCLARDAAPLRAALAETMRAQRPAPEQGERIGLGWFITDEAVPVFHHGGATDSSHAFVGFRPGANCGVVALANCDSPTAQLGFSLLGAKPPQPASTKVARATDYIGLYPLSPKLAIGITEQDGKLFEQVTGQTRIALREVETDRFAIAGIPAEISFERDAEGKVTMLILHQNGGEQRGVRGALPPPAKEIVLPAESLADYVGEYQANPQFSFVVTARGDGLAVQLSGQGANPVFASAQDEFFYKVVDARITFKRDAAGKIVGLVLHQGGRDLAAKKTP